MPKAKKTVGVQVPAEYFWNMITDYERYPDYISNCTTATIVSNNNDVVVAAFTVKVVRTFDYTLQLVLDAEHYRVDWTLVESKTLRQNDGGWQLTETQPGHTMVTYWNDLAAKFWLPKAFLNGLVQIALPSMLKEWRLLAERRWRDDNGSPPA